MARPKKGAKGCEEANRKWKETMLRRYGSEEGIHRQMVEMGAKGGRNGRGPDYRGGFAADRERARIAGALGGRKSRRTGKYTAIMEENKKAIIATINGPGTLKSLAEAMGVPYSSLTNYVTKNNLRG